MAIKLKAKTYGPLTLVSEGAGALSFRTEGGHDGVGIRAPAANGFAPSDLLLASLGSCILISARMAADDMDRDLGEVNASVYAEKALDLPHRFAKLTVEVRGKAFGTWSQQHMDELKQRTKSLCTISNTLGAEVTVIIVAE
ncbi:MAG: OsmC family protein [Burkholderiaceae bacterium]